MGCLKAGVRQSDQHLFFFYTTNTNLLVQKDPEACLISALDGERSLFRSLPKNCTEKHSQFSVDFTESAVILSCLTHCAPTLKTTWYVIHTSVWCDNNSSMLPIFPPFLFQDAHDTLAPTSSIVETTLPMQSDTHWSQMFSKQWVIGE